METPQWCPKCVWYLRDKIHGVAQFFWHFLLEISSWKWSSRNLQRRRIPATLLWDCWMEEMIEKKTFFLYLVGLCQAQFRFSQRGGNQEGLKGFWRPHPGSWNGLGWKILKNHPVPIPFCLQKPALTQTLRFFPLSLPWNCFFFHEGNLPWLPCRALFSSRQEKLLKVQKIKIVYWGYERLIWAEMLLWSCPSSSFLVFSCLGRICIKHWGVFVGVSIVCALISTPKKN